jgi:hypothetical protein
VFLHNLGAGLLRRWYFVLAGVLLTLGGGLFTWSVVPPSYEATSTAVLLPPASLVGEEGNPYLYMGGLDQVLTVLTVRLNSTEVAEPLLQGRGRVEFTVEKNVTTPGPIMLVRATGESRDSAMQLLQDVVAVVPENLIVMQDQLRIPTFSRVDVMTVVQDDEPALMIKDQLRTLLAAVAGGLAMTVLATAVLDRALMNRTIKRGRRTRSGGGQAATHGEVKLDGHRSGVPGSGALDGIPEDDHETMKPSSATLQGGELELPTLAPKK